MHDRGHWLFELPCGCNEAVSTIEHHPTKAIAWKSMYGTQKERDAALNRGVTIKQITHEEWRNEHIHRHGRCSHG